MMATASLSIELPRHPGSSRMARAALRPLEDHLGARSEDVTLLVSELLANAVEHGEGEAVGLTVHVEAGRVHAEVVDRGHGFAPPALAPDPLRLRGRGLQIVDRLADDWGVFEGDSTHVWFELDL
jgi:anti-sigma regulatory factor (Ser/Thr protein kinase)